MTDKKRIYTGTGDDGTTSLIGGKRVSKASLRMEANGTVDELSSLLGIVRAECKINDVPSDEITDIALSIQKDLINIGTMLALPAGEKGMEVPGIAPERIIWLEDMIDGIQAGLAPLKTFVIPGDNKASSYMHHARTVCRRAERLIVSLYEKEAVDTAVLKYFNRLSDLLFVLGRALAP